jgi:NADPH:quinone reductase-like Zn-dependent oxidoreductase
MKAVIWTRYGPPDVLQLQEVAKPTPKDDEVLIKVHATTVTAGDCEMRSLKLPLYFALPMRAYAGLSRPKSIQIMGQELAGAVEAVGKDVTAFKPGDRVFGTTGFGMGAYAEYACLPAGAAGLAGTLAIMPANMMYEQAAAVALGGLEALHFLRQAQIQPGQYVLINGAGGSIGVMAVQLARQDGAEVTAVDSGEKLAMLRTIGADRVVDYRQEDFTRRGQACDVIFDVAGKSPFSASLRSLKPGGCYLLANPDLAQRLRAPWNSSRDGKRVVIGSASHKAEDLVFLAGLIEASKIKAVIDRYYPLAQIAEAHRYVETGRKQGSVVITVA